MTLTMTLFFCFMDSVVVIANLQVIYSTNYFDGKFYAMGSRFQIAQFQFVKALSTIFLGGKRKWLGFIFQVYMRDGG